MRNPALPHSICLKTGHLQFVEAGYSGPLTLPMLRHNEVLIQID